MYKNIVERAEAKDIVFVAHSYGGAAIAHLLNYYGRICPVTISGPCLKRLRCVALTDCSHSYMPHENPVIRSFVRNKICNCGNNSNHN